MALDGLLPERTGPTRAAVEVAVRFQTPSLLEHCFRSYLWASDLGQTLGLDLDRELLYVAAMLHDLGLSPSFDNVSHPFEVAGGDLAWVFGAAGGWTEPRRNKARAIIIEHMHEQEPPKDQSPESHVLHLATGFDISGCNPDLWSAALKRSVLARHPRLDLAREFSEAFADQARRKPGCAAAASVNSGIAVRIAANPLETLSD